MAVFTTSDDLLIVLGTVSDPTRAAALIPFAERELARLAGRLFYDATDRTTAASQDWIEATALLVEQRLADESESVRAARLGAFQSETIEGYSYRVKDAVLTGTVIPPRVLAIVQAYRLTGYTPLALRVSGPTRSRGTGIEGAERDVSREVTT